MTQHDDKKYDMKKRHKELYAPKNRDWAEVHVPETSYVAVDGRGDPNTAPAHAEAVQALYATAYAVKFAAKRRGEDFVVGPLEGLWHAADMDAFTVARDKSQWEWTMMIAQPERVSAAAVDEAVASVRARKSLPALDELRFATLAEGRCAQVLHIGSYDDEAPILDRLHREWMPERGLGFNGRHHEIYLGDPRRVAPERLRTILRQPIKQL